MIANIATLILALAVLLAVVGGIFVLYRPPKRLTKFKLKDLEGEFAPEKPVAAPEPAQLPAVGAAEAAPAPTTLEKVQPEQPGQVEAPGFQEIFKAFKEHQYAEGMKLARLAIASSGTESKFDNETFYVWVAHLEGNPEAYSDAEKLATDHPQLFEAQYYFGLISDRTGKTDAAIALLKKALTLGTDVDDRVNAAAALQRVLSRIERYKEALQILNDQLKKTDAPALRAELFVSMAKVYAEATPVDYRAMFLMYELAITNAPDDTKLRFQVAYKYSNQNAHELAFVHYRRLFQNDPKDVMALNNIGVDAESLDLSLTAVSYYKSSQALDNTLASANLANRLIDAGFKEEAEAVLAQAKTKADVHRNVSFSFGKLAQAESSEEQKIRKIAERAGKVRRWHVRHGEATLHDCEPTALSGSYSGTPAGLELTVQADGTAKGTFALTSTMAAVLTGNVNGAALAFDWTGESTEKGILSYLSRKSGHGLLIASAKDQLDGYWAEGSQAIDAKDVDSWNPWHLSKNPSS